MSTFYLEMLSTGGPFNIGPDANSRHMFSVNFYCRARGPVDKLEEEVYKLLMDASLVTGLGVDTFIGMNSVIDEKTTPGPFVEIIRTSALPNEETHNGDKYERPTFQVVTRAKSYVIGRNLSLSIWRLLDGKRNFTVAAA